MVHWEQLAHKPATMSFEHAACLVTAGMTALQMLDLAGAMNHDGNVKRLFITAGPGGVGHYALQLAKKVAKVPVVITTASSSKANFVRRCGADEVIDYKTTKFVDALASNKCDAALDCTGEISSCKKVVRPRGTVVSIHGLPSASMLRSVIQSYHMDPLPCMCCVDCFLNSVGWCNSCCSSVRVHNIVTLPIGSQLENLANICVREHIEPTIDRVFSLEAAPAAFDYVEAGHVTGKVLVEIVPGAAAPGSAAKET
jgi:alcohol dehydrogenase